MLALLNADKHTALHNLMIQIALKSRPTLNILIKSSSQLSNSFKTHQLTR